MFEFALGVLALRELVLVGFHARNHTFLVLVEPGDFESVLIAVIFQGLVSLRSEAVRVSRELVVKRCAAFDVAPGKGIFD